MHTKIPPTSLTVTVPAGQQLTSKGYCLQMQRSYSVKATTQTGALR